MNLENMASYFAMLTNLMHYSITATKRYSAVKICFALQKQTLTQRYHSHKVILKQAAVHLSLWFVSERTCSFPASSFFSHGFHQCLKQARCPTKSSPQICTTIPLPFGSARTNWLGILVYFVTVPSFLLNNKNWKQLPEWGEGGKIHCTEK